MKSGYFIIAVLLICLMSGCSGQKYQTREESHGLSDRLNYDYTNRYFKKTVQKDHFLLAVSVDSPAIISFGDVDFAPVYSRGGIEGNALVKVTVSPDGRVSTLKFVKRAGLGIDEYIENIIRDSRFIPVRYRGKNQKSGFIVNVLVKEL